MSKEREHIEKIRKEKFWLDEKGNLSKENPLIDDLINSIERLSESLYSKDTHFIFELIQNAEDNKYYEGTEPSISFLLVKADPTNTPNSGGAMIIQNNEIGFSPDNVDAICSIGKTTKNKLQGYIGEKGIGFKSVFRITTIPHIFSDGYQFCFPEKDEKTSLGYIVPRWIEDIPYGVDPKQTMIILPLDKPDFGYERIEGMLQDIEPETILFLSKLKEIQIKTDSGDDLTILKDDKQSPLIQLLIEGTKQGKSYSDVKEFLLFTHTVDRPQDVIHEKRVGIDKRDVSIAFPVGDNKDSMGKIFAYLPVRSDTGFPFLINADFILPSSREDIQDVSWNRWLIRCLANLLAENLPVLKEKNLLTVDFLEALTKRLNDLDETNIFYPIVEVVRDALMDQELLPADDGTFVSARNAKLARGAELRKLLTHDQLRELFQSKDDIKWLSGEITQDRTPELRSYLMSELAVEEITPDGFARRISSTFLTSQTDDWFIAFYKYLSGQEALWRPPRWAGDSGGLLRRKPILRLQDNKQEVPFCSDGMANAYLPPPEETALPVVKREIVDNEQVSEFLRRLGLSEPDVFDDIVERVLPKYSRYDVSSITPREHATDIQKILRAMASDSETGKEKVLRAAKNAPFLKAVDQNGNSSFKRPDDIYFPSDELKDYFYGYRDVWFLDEAAGEKQWKAFGVENKPRFKKISIDLPWEEKSRLRGNQGHTRDIETIDYQLDGLENFLMRFESEDSQPIENALILWNFLVHHLQERHHYSFYEGEYKWFYYQERSVRFDARWKKQIRSYAWLPKKGDIRFHKPRDLSPKELPDLFIRDEKLIDLLEMKKDVVAKLAEEAGISHDTIKLAQELEKQPPEIRKRIEKILKEQDGRQPSFPTRISTDLHRREGTLAEQISNALEKEYKRRNRSIRTTASTIDKETYLRNAYTNDDGQMICQICKEEMPFKKRDGKYYFEAVEAFSRDHFPKEHEAQFLALCPVCAAMYKEFVKQDEGAMSSLKKALINSKKAEIPLRLGDEDTSLRFVETHFVDIKTIIKDQ